jgi:hypothetical protein
MAVHGVSGSTPPIPHQSVNTQRVQPKQDNDGDNDGSRAGEVEAQESNHSVSSGYTPGSIINTTA